MENTLYYGDNLEVLRDHIASESVDLIYLDPPFNSNQDYNVLFAERDGKKSQAQIKAFEDTWTWDEEAARSFQQIVEAGGAVSTVMRAFRTFMGDSDMLAYLAMMAPRLVELRRVLKPNGSIYLHCDPTASHYLKLLLDSVFGPELFKNEIIWKRTTAHSAAKRWNEVHDTILFYTKSDSFTWNEVLIEHSAEYAARYRNEDASGKLWADDNLTGPGVRHGDSGATWRGFNPTAKGLHWKVNLKTVESLVGADKAKELTTTQKLDVLDAHGCIHWPRQGQGFPRFKRFLSAGTKIQDVVTDIPPINSQAQERLGYPTQKPEPLLERIIKASSNERDVVLDPFCGCGTAVAVAERLKRNWIGIDITHLAITLIKHRLETAYQGKVTYKVVGEPVSLPDAKTLAASDPYQFQLWALGLVGARPTALKKGADKGIDGRLLFHDDPNADTKQIIISVKAGEHISSAFVRDLRGVIEREEAQIGVLISMEPPTRDMRKEAASAGFYKSPWGTHPRIQLLTIEDLLSGKRIDYPPSQQVDVTFKKSKKAATSDAAKQMTLGSEPDEPF